VGGLSVFTGVNGKIVLFPTTQPAQVNADLKVGVGAAFGLGIELGSVSYFGSTITVPTSISFFVGVGFGASEHSGFGTEITKTIYESTLATRN
jgi:hypothetical protein